MSHLVRATLLAPPLAVPLCGALGLWAVLVVRAQSTRALFSRILLRCFHVTRGPIVAAIIALAACLCHTAAPASAQVVSPVFVTGSATQTQSFWYKAQQYIHEAQILSYDIQRFQIAYRNYQRYGGIANMISAITPMIQMSTDIQTAISQGQNPGLAAEVSRNKLVMQNLSVIQSLASMNGSAMGTAQLLQVANTISATALSDTMQQHEVDYAKAQAQAQAQQNQTNLSALDNAQAFHP